MGACVTGDTLITLLDDTYQSIKQIVEEQKIKQIPCIDIETGKITIGDISQYCDMGVRSTLEITLVSGKKLCGTYEHPVILRTGNAKQYCYNWTRLDQLHIGDLVATKLANNIYFEAVTNIKDAGQQHVYDLTIDTYHSFISNDIVSHNTNAKIVKIGTPKTRNHFYDSIEGQSSSQWTVVKRDWTQCAQLWALSATQLPDHEDPAHQRIRPYSTFVLSLMPKSLKQEYFPTRPDIWTEGQMSVEDFKTQYMLEFVDGAGQFLTLEERKLLTAGEFDWLEHGSREETYVAGIDFAGSSSDNADFTHISVFRVTPDNIKQKVYAEEMQGISYPEQERFIVSLLGGPRPKFACKAIFADYTGCGRPVVQTLIETYGMTNLTGVTFNATDTYTHTGMNLKNAMYAHAKQEIDYGRMQYPTEERYLNSAGKGRIGFYHKMIGEWSDLECETRTGVNKRISAPSGCHDDVPSSDILGTFASIVGLQRRSPVRASIGHSWR